MNRKVLVILILILVFCGQSVSQAGTKKRRPLPHEYGRIVINNYSEKANLSPVVFEHWIHRSKFTCRVCHVDVGFAMRAGATDIKAVHNERGFYCGACHNGRRVVDGKTVFEACSKRVTGDESDRCDRCHSQGKKVASSYVFFGFSRSLPTERFGNGIDWEKSEELGFIHPSSTLDGVSIPRNALAVQKDFALTPKVEGIPDIIFSHAKHTVWNGCELCHPEIFIGVKRGATQYTMVDNFQGRSCGVCHTTVAFPLTDCQRCHCQAGPTPSRGIHAQNEDQHDVAVSWAHRSTRPVCRQGCHPRGADVGSIRRVVTLPLAMESLCMVNSV